MKDLTEAFRWDGVGARHRHSSVAALKILFRTSTAIIFSLNVVRFTPSQLSNFALSLLLMVPFVDKPLFLALLLFGSIFWRAQMGRRRRLPRDT